MAAQLQKRQDLICNTMQATLLLRFNRVQDGVCTSDGDPMLSVQQLMEGMGVDELTVKKLLGSLIMGRFKILRKVRVLQLSGGAGLVLTKECGAACA